MKKVGYGACAAVFLAMIVCCGSCGGGDGGTAATVVLKDAAGNTLNATGSTATNPSAFTLSFDRAMDVDSVTTAGNITLGCGDLSPTMTITSTSSTEFAIAVADAYKYQLLDCVLTITTHVRTAEGVASASDQAYAFSVSACAVSDDFNADSRNCWQVVTSGDVGAPLTWESWNAFLAPTGPLTFNSAASTLDYDNSAQAPDTTTVGEFSKAITIDPAGFSVIFHVRSLSGFDTPSPAEGQPGDGLNLYVAENINLDGALFAFQTGPAQGARDCQLMYITADRENFPVGLFDCRSVGSGGVYLKIAVVNQVVSFQSSSDGVAYADIPLIRGTLPSGQSFTNMRYLISNMTALSNDDQAGIDSIVTSGISVSGQY